MESVEEKRMKVCKMNKSIACKSNQFYGRNAVFFKIDLLEKKWEEKWEWKKYEYLFWYIKMMNLK